MRSPFYQRPEKRKFNYKPRFYEPDGGTKDKQGNFDPDKFANRLHRSWGAKRQQSKETRTSNRRVIWLLFIVIVLVYLAYKFIFKI